MLELFVFGATITVAAWVAGADAHRRVAAARALDRYAAARQLVFVPAKARDASPKVIGAKDEIPFAIDLYRLNGEMRTRVSTDAPRGRSAVLSVGQRDAFAWQREAVLVLGEEAFDRAYLVMTGAHDDADALRDATAPLVLLAELRHGIWLRSDGHKIAISWRGTESDPIVLDAARDAVVLLAGTHRPETPYR